MLIAGIVLGVVLGLIAGGSIWNLAGVRLRRLSFIAAAVLIRLATEAAIAGGIPAAESLRLPLYTSAYAILLAGLWPNRSFPGISLAFVGILANGIAIAANGGHMPIWEPSLLAAEIGLDEVRSSFHIVLPAALDADFLIKAGPFADVIPIPFPVIRNVASIGDVFLSSGLAFFLFATVLHAPDELDEAEMALIDQRLRGVAIPRRGHGTATALRESRVRPETALGSASAVAAPVAEALFRPLGSEPVALETAGAVAGLESAIARPAQPPFLERARRHPYVRLALNGSFSALWTGQLISLFGDRIHQIAAVVLVLQLTGSPLAVAAVFVAATIPNLFLSPLAGTFVDRWDQHDVLVASDLLRAALVLIIPIAAVTNVLLVYPLTFLVASVSVFFRPARVAVLPRIVQEDDLVTANSLSWMAETLADIVGYAVAGVFVAFLGSALPLAFWIDAATYVASAALLWTIVVPPIARPEGEAETPPNFRAEFSDGWRFLRRETVLLANTVQATVGQFTIGILIVLTPIYVTDALHATTKEFPAFYAFLETGIGVGNLVGGFLIGLVGARLPKGRTVIFGYVVAGACIALLGVTGNLAVAVALVTGFGIANMVFVIPSQTLFQTRVPADLIGRVVGFRFAIVSGSLALAMTVGGVLGEVFGAAVVIGAFGVLTLVAGLSGVLVPAVRDA